MAYSVYVQYIQTQKLHILILHLFWINFPYKKGNNIEEERIMKTDIIVRLHGWCFGT